MKTLKLLSLTFLILISCSLFSQSFTNLFTPNLHFVKNGDVKWGDYDNDGDLDVLVCGETNTATIISKIYRNDGSNNFVNVNANIEGVKVCDVEWLDFDNDGDLDIIAAGTNQAGTDTVYIYRNDSNNVFTGIPHSIPHLNSPSIDYGDFNQDGKLDLLISGRSGATTSLTLIYKNEGNGIFSDINAGITGVMTGDAKWGDYDNDGDLDFLVSGFNTLTSSGYTMLYNNNNGIFTTVSTSIIATQGGAIEWGDYDNDNDLDILISGSSAGYFSKIYINDGSGVFTDINANLEGVVNANVDFGDYDNDGLLDVFISGNYYNAGWHYVSNVYKNNGSNSFTDINAFIGANGDMSGSGEWGDYDNDGDIDLLVCGIDASLQGNTLIIRNNTSTPNTNPTKSTYRNTVVNGDTATMFWNRCTDNETTQLGLTYNVYVGDGLAASSYDESTLSSMSNVLPNFLSPVPFGYRRIARMGNALQDTSLTLINLPPNTYYWSVQTIDNGYLGSIFAAAQVFNILPTSTFVPATDTICFNDTLTVQYLGTGDTSYTYHWDFNGGTLLTNNFDSTLTVTFPSGGMKQISLYLTKNAAKSNTNYFNVFVNTVDTSTSQNGTTLTSNATGAIYQWIDCNNGNALITGETNANYNATAIGNYAVIVTEGSCSDTSACVNITCVPTSANFSVTECINYTIPSGNNTITAIGTQTIMDTIANSCGLDSVMTISVTILPQLTGIYNETICFGGSVIVNGTTYNATNLTGTEVFTVGVNNCDSTVSVNLTISPQLTGVYNETICFGDSIVVNGTTYNATNLTGSEVFTVGVNNCDSTVSVNLTILSAIDISTAQNGATLTSNAIGATYQWIDCDNGNTSIGGEINQSFTATISGNYAVIVIENSCTDTSACVNLVVTGVGDINNRSNIKLYPNPTNNNVTLTLNETQRSISVVMRDVGGRSVLDKVFENKRNISLNLENVDAGIYFMSVTFDGETSVVKLIKD